MLLKIYCGLNSSNKCNTMLKRIGPESHLKSHPRKAFKMFSSDPPKCDSFGILCSQIFSCCCNHIFISKSTFNIFEEENSPMQDFLSGVNFIYLVTLATAAISGWYGYSKYRYEKKLEKFKETNTDLFNKDDKQLVLAAIATLSIFKKDKQF